MLQLVLAIEQALGGVADKAGEGVCEVEGLVEAVGLLLSCRASCGWGWGAGTFGKVSSPKLGTPMNENGT